MVTISPELIIHSNLPIIQFFCSRHFPLLFNLALHSNNFDLLFNLYSEVGKYIFQVQYKNKTMRHKGCMYTSNENYWKKTLTLSRGLTDLGSLEPFHEPFVFLAAAGYLRLRVRSEAFGAFRASRIAK